MPALVWIGGGVGLLAGLIALLFAGCMPNTPAVTQSVSATTQIRVRLLESQESVFVTASRDPVVTTQSEPGPSPIHFPTGEPVKVSYSSFGWQVGSATLGKGVMTLEPAADGSLSINGQAYRGGFRFVPTMFSMFDVVNDAPLEGYLKGVLPRELFPSWHFEAFKAQAVVARTYALYVSRTEGTNRYWDVYADQRSQVYGGMMAETAKSGAAVDETVGDVLTYGPGSGRLFKAYFSSCCGGVTQAVSDAFPGDPLIPPLSSQDNGTTCSASPYFRWGPVQLSKAELTRRFRQWGSRHTPVRPEAFMGNLVELDLAVTNALGRPVRFRMVDDRGDVFNLPAEDMRAAVNTDDGPTPTLRSSFCKVNSDRASSYVMFYDGRGFGHGVGMCQWCAQARALQGMNYAQILAIAYPGSNLIQIAE